MRKNILVVTTEFPNQAEPTRSVFNRETLVNLKRNASIKIISPIPFVPRFIKNGYKSIPFKEELDGIEVMHPRYLVIPKIGRALHGFLYFLAIFFLAKRIRKNFDFDLIYGIWAYPDGFASVLLAKMLKKPVIIQALGCDINHFTNYAILKRLIVFAMNRADRVIVVSENLRNRLLKLGIATEKITKIVNGVDINKFYPIDMQKARAKLNLPYGKKILLFVGRLSEEKGVDYLIESLSLLRKQNINNFILYILGDGKLRKNINNQVERAELQQFVTFVGEVKHNDIVYWINAANFICLPSKREGCPNVILEALACAKPVVATRVGEIPNIVKNKECGILVTPQDSQELCDGIRMALENNWDDAILREQRYCRTWEDVSKEIHLQINRVINNEAFKSVEK